MCGTVQLTVDILIILQILAYRNNEQQKVSTHEKGPENDAENTT